jgi:hypothetical protein
VDRYAAVEVCLRRAHLHRYAEPLKHLIGVLAYDLLCHVSISRNVAKKRSRAFHLQACSSIHHKAPRNTYLSCASPRLSRRDPRR